MGCSGRQRAQGPFVSRQPQAGSSRAPQTPGQTSTVVPENWSPRSQTSWLHVGNSTWEAAWNRLLGPWREWWPERLCVILATTCPASLPASPPCSRKQMQTASVGVKRPWLPTHCGTLGKAFPALGLSVSICKMCG